MQHAAVLFMSWLHSPTSPSSPPPGQGFVPLTLACLAAASMTSVSEGAY